MTATAVGLQTGRKSRTYYNTGTRSSPVWVLITHITKETFEPGEQDFFQANARDIARKLQEEDAVNPASLTFSRLIKKGVSDAVYTALVASYGYAGTAYEFAVMDDAIENTGAKGWRFWGKISKMPVTRDLGQFNEQQWEVKEIVHYTAGGTLEQLVALTGPSGSGTTTTAPATTTTAA